jgi:hypothetical protein
LIWLFMRIGCMDLAVEFAVATRLTRRERREDTDREREAVIADTVPMNYCCIQDNGSSLT